MSLQTKLLRWFQKNQRPLPWRKTYDPYEVWVSEIMLQQTQMDTAVPYFERWVRLFPDIKALARSGEKKVLKAWEGLGYYSRARNLRETARRIVRDFDGRFPADAAAILSLKGIGPYTAGAIASIAFNQPEPIVDGNVIRVLSRLFAIAKPYDTEENKKIFWNKQRSLIPAGRARDFNQSLMELGALICTPQTPACPACPVRRECQAFSRERVNEFPVKRIRKRQVRIGAGALVLKKEGRYFIHRRPVGKIMGGLWEFPEWKLTRNRSLGAGQAKTKTLREIRREFGETPERLEYLGSVKRSYTHHAETLQVFAASTSNGMRPTGARKEWPSAWVRPRDFAKYPFSSAHSKIAKLLT